MSLVYPQMTELRSTQMMQLVYFMEYKLCYNFYHRLLKVKQQLKMFPGLFLLLRSQIIPALAGGGFIFDISRHFFNKEQVKQYIDVMVKYKYNLLHLTLANDEGWRVE